MNQLADAVMFFVRRETSDVKCEI